MATTVQSTQKHLNIVQIKNGIVYTRTGEIRAVLEAKPLNFALKSEADQNAIIGQYQNFLNSLNFSIQIIVQSRRLDLHPYLKALEGYAGKISVELLRLQALDYIDFVSKLTTLANVMDKKFYIVVPFDPAPIQKIGFLGKIFGNQRKDVIKFSPQQLENYLNILKERVNVVNQGFSGMKVDTRLLTTQEVIELFYSVFNPEEAAEERLTQVENMEASVIQKQVPATEGQILATKTVENTANPLNQAVSSSQPNEAPTNG